MKRVTLIAITGGIVLLVVLTWGYLFIFGTPQSAEQIFARFGIVGSGVPGAGFVNSTIVDTGTTSNDGSPQELRQLTLAPVAGMTFVDSNTIRYVERGTGYIHEIDIPSGNERQITNTTIPKVISARFSPSGNRAVIETEGGNAIQTSIGTVTKSDSGESELQTTDLPLGAHDADFTSDGNEVHYLLPTGDGGSAGHAHDTTKGTDRVLFLVPFVDAHAVWGAPTYLYTAPSAALTGYVYRISGATLQYVSSGGAGLTAFSYPGGLVTAEAVGENIKTYAYQGNTRYEIPLETFPEKCTSIANSTTTLLCAAPLALPTDITYPDDWYKGAVSFEDVLWDINTINETATLIADPLAATGRAVDVAKIVASADGTEFLFVNKNDNTLWLYIPSSQ